MKRTTCELRQNGPHEDSRNKVAIGCPKGTRTGPAGPGSGTHGREHSHWGVTLDHLRMEERGRWAEDARIIEAKNGPQARSPIAPDRQAAQAVGEGVAARRIRPGLRGGLLDTGSNRESDLERVWAALLSVGRLARHEAHGLDKPEATAAGATARRREGRGVAPAIMAPDKKSLVASARPWFSRTKAGFPWCRRSSDPGHPGARRRLSGRASPTTPESTSSEPWRSPPAAKGFDLSPKATAIRSRANKSSPSSSGFCGQSAGPSYWFGTTRRSTPESRSVNSSRRIRGLPCPTFRAMRPSSTRWSSSGRSFPSSWLAERRCTSLSSPNWFTRDCNGRERQQSACGRASAARHSGGGHGDMSVKKFKSQ